MANSAVKTTTLLLWLILTSLSINAQTSSGGKCSESPEYYEQNSYTVHDVRVATPLDWLFGSVDRALTAILADPAMPIKSGAIYRKANADAGFIKLQSQFPELTVNPSDRIAVRLAAPALENCSQQKKSLDVVYHVYTFSFSYYVTRAFESGQKNEVKRSVVDTSATERLVRFFPQPFIGYNRSRHLFGGSKLSIRPNGRWLNKMFLQADASSSSVEAAGEAGGARDFDQGFISHLEYQLGYTYSDVPGDAIKLKQSNGLGQIFLATRAFGPAEAILRFGGMVEGGNKQTNFAGTLPPDQLASSGYGSIKGFVGGSVRLGRHALKSSYGLQLGTARQGSGLDYIKQVFDSAANLRFLIRDHRPLTLDLQFTAGSISHRRQVPVAEQFFGGNVETNFIASDSWVIRSNPFIRSFPQNGFNRVSVTATPGADSFFSANVTFAPTIWSRPLVPSEILAEPDFPTLVEFEFSAAESSLRNEYLSGTPEFGTMAGMVKPLASSLQAIDQELKQIEQSNPTQEVSDQISLCRTDLNIANETAETIKSDLESGSPKTADIRKLVVGFPTKTPPISSYVSDLVDDLTILTKLPSLPSPNHLAERTAELENRRELMANAFLDLDQSTIAKAQEQKAQRDMKYPRRVFDQLTHEANLFAVSPVAIFDIARLRQNAPRATALRYAVGGGVRLSIVSLDITGAYAWNPTRQPGESRGALVFSMEVSNLFR